MTVLNSPPNLRRVRELIGGSASPHLNVGDVKQFPIPLPPLIEQDQIASEVAEKLSQIEAADAAIKRAQRKAASAFERDGNVYKPDAFKGPDKPKDPRNLH